MIWQSESAAGLASHRARTIDEAGFTLLELLVVLAIMTVLIVVVPRATAGLPSLRLRGAAYNLTETLRRARDEAVQTGRTTEVLIDAEDRKYVWRGEPIQLLPSDVDGMSANRSGLGPGHNVDRLRFFADGSATGGTISLRQNSRSIAITVEWLTGRVRLDD